MKSNLVYIVSEIDKAVFFELTARYLQKEFNLSFVLINCQNSELEKFLLDQDIPFDHVYCPSISRSLKAIKETKRILKERNCEIVHCHMALANWVGLLAAKRIGIKHRIFTRHSGKPLVHSWKEGIIDKVQNRVATTIVAISKNIEKLLLDLEVAPEKIKLIHHGFDVERFVNVDHEEAQRIRNKYNRNGQSPVIGVIARWMEWKGVQHILEAFILFLETEPEAKICLFGGEVGDYVTEIRTLLNRIPEKNKLSVAFENNVYELYDLFDMYIHTPVNPYCEAFGQTYVEALLKKKPCIFTKSGIASEFIVHLENAYVVDFKSPQQILSGMKYLIESPENQQKMVENGFSDATRLFSAEVYLSRINQLYQSTRNN